MPLIEKIHRTLIALLIGATAGCAVGPNYSKPSANAPAQWSKPLAERATNHYDSGTAWWTMFHDPELDSLISRAVATNTDLSVAEVRVREARAQHGMVRADPTPLVDASTSFRKEAQSANQPLAGDPLLSSGVSFENDVYQTGYDASWEIGVFRGKRQATEAATAEVTASELSRRNVLVSLLGEVARNYVETRASQRRLSIAEENIEAQEEALAIASDRFQHGLTGELEVKQAASLLAITRSEIPSLESSIQLSIRRLGVLLAQPPNALLSELSTVAPIPSSPPEVPVGLPSDLLLRRPDIQQAERELAAATAQNGAATTDWFPDVFLTGDAGVQSMGSTDRSSGYSKSWSFSPTVQWRSFDAGRIRANIRIQDARQEQALARYEQTVLTSFEEVENALASYADDQVRRRSLTTAVKSRQDALVLSRNLYANGRANLLNVLDAERSLYLAEDSLAQSDQAVTQDLIVLYKALGGGWEQFS
jgi:NodT family efflux transporter outer membrane factor (OMF) lipoprotein